MKTIRSDNMIKEALNKSILDLSEHGKRKCDFRFPLKFNDLQPLNLAIRPCIAGTSDLIRGSLSVRGTGICYE